MNLRDAQKSEAILCSILDDRRAAPLLSARRATNSCYQPISTDLAQRASIPCAARNFQKLSQH
ncbi:hypothetical protein A2U01_0005740 [Trifolium medium]|uniref:Uncharacterized protein n=1 Tax=Trifolium medium TaxID=97028 RepID=A0A392MCL9_9FABA|nr:hypothetical protein [Trifolium medium]